MARADAHTHADAIVAAARALVGVRFRPQGRGADGLDCLGVALTAAQAGGLSPVSLPAFAMRGTALEQGNAWLRACGCRRLAVPAARPGDLLLGVPAALQLHLAVVTQGGLVEAHAGLGRVIERPMGSMEAWDSGWRLPAREE